MIINKKIIDEVLKIALEESQLAARKFLQKKTGLKETQARFWTKKIIKGNSFEEMNPISISLPLNKNKNSFKSFGENAQVVSSDPKIKTLEELLIACNVDKNKWIVDSWIANKWDGLQSVINSEGVKISQIVPLYQIKATLKRRKIIISSEKFAEEFKNAVSNIKRMQVKTIRNAKKKDCLLNLTIGSDLHFGRKTWGKETSKGSDYDIKIASSLFTQGIDSILEQVPKDRIEKIILPIGGDFFNAEGLRETTTRGIEQYQDSRWQKIFLEGCGLVAANIEKLLEIAPVQVIPIIGNHDCESLQHLGFYLKAWFRKNNRFTIDDKHTERKYIQYGSNLIGFYHGHNIKHEQLPIIMANDCPEEWAKTKSRIFITGHYHHQQVKEYKGVIIKVLPSLVPPDQWHDSHGFIGNIRAGEGLLHNRDTGIIANYYYNVHE